MISKISNYLKDALLDEFSAINDVPNDEDNVDEKEGDQSGVAKVLSVNVGVSVAQLQGCCGKENVVAIVTMSVTKDMLKIFLEICIWRCRPKITGASQQLLKKVADL